MAQGRKFYAVFVGRVPGVYTNWDEAQAQVENFPGAKYRSYDSCEDATLAFRRYGEAADVEIFRRMAQHRPMVINYAQFPEIRLDAIAVDGACNRNPGGDVEKQRVRETTGERLFHVGPYPGGSNNIGEYLGLVHALALLAKYGDSTTPIYTDSITALSWLRRRKHNSKLTFPPGSILAQLLARADAWLATHTFSNPVLKWNTETWGEIPADFGRK